MTIVSRMAPPLSARVKKRKIGWRYGRGPLTTKQMFLQGLWTILAADHTQATQHKHFKTPVGAGLCSPHTCLECQCCRAWSYSISSTLLCFPKEISPSYWSMSKYSSGLTVLSLMKHWIFIYFTDTTRLRLTNKDGIFLPSSNENRVSFKDLSNKRQLCEHPPATWQVYETGRISKYGAYCSERKRRTFHKQSVQAKAIQNTRDKYCLRFPRNLF